MGSRPLKNEKIVIDKGVLSVFCMKNHLKTKFFEMPYIYFLLKLVYTKERMIS